MNKTNKDVYKEITEELLQLPKEELKKKIDEHSNGEFAKQLNDLIKEINDMCNYNS